MLAFAIIGAFGIVVLLASLTFGELLEAFDVADTGFSSMAIGVTLTGVGAIGVATTVNGLPLWAAFAASLLGGGLLGAFMQTMVRRLIATESGHAVFDVIDVEGTLTAATGPAGGEVRLDDPREVESRLAWSNEQMPSGTRVRVITQNGSRVQVEAV